MTISEPIPHLLVIQILTGLAFQQSGQAIMAVEEAMRKAMPGEKPGEKPGEIPPQRANGLGNPFEGAE